MTDSLRTAMNRANPNTLGDEMRLVAIGDVLGGQLTQQLRQQTPTANDPGSPASTVQVIKLPNGAKCGKISRAQSRAGTLAGELTVDAQSNTAPASGHIGVQPNGDIMLLTSDAQLGVDVVYNPERGDVVTLPNVNVASNAYVFPAALTARGVILLLSATSVTGTLTGALRVLVPVTASPATGKAQLDIAKSMVQFATADAVTVATLVLLVTPAVDLAVRLNADSTVL